MSRWRPDPIALTVGGEHLQGADTTGPLDGGWPAALARWADQVALPRGTPLRVSIADHWVRYWVCSPPRGLGGLAELRAVVGARFEDLFRASAADWCIEADWRADRPFLCAAVPAPLRAALCAVTAERGWRLAGVVPASVDGFNRMPLGRAVNAWALCFRPDGFNAMLLEDGRPRDVRQHWTDEPPTATEVMARLRAQAMVAGVDMPTRFVTDGPAPRLEPAA